MTLALLLGLAAQADDAFPLRVGARWTYAQGDTAVMVLDAVEASKVGDEATITVRIRSRSFFWATYDAFLSAGQGGLRMHASSYADTLMPKTPAWILLPPRLETGAGWTGGDGHFEAKVLGREDVDIPAGRFSAWKIEYVRRGHLGTELDFRAWHAPGTGFVRFEFFQTSTMGAKTPLETPARLDLVRFEPARRGVPVEIPALHEADRKEVDALLVRLGDPAVEVREKAAADLLSKGRGILPVLRSAAAKAADPELQARLRHVRDRFPALEFTARKTRERGQVGRPLPLSFALRNISLDPVRIVPALDGSAFARFPRYGLVVRNEEGVEQQPDRIPFCGTLNPLRARDFVELAPGEEVDPLGPGSFSHSLLRWTPTRPGTYTLEAAYDATGKIPDAWKGSAAEMAPNVRAMLEAMPRGRYEAPRLTIVVEP